MNYSFVEKGKVKTQNIDDVKFDLTADVLAVGAGCAGIYVADSASRLGKKVILIENGNSIGGMHVEGNVGGYYYGFMGGAYEQVDQESLNDKPFFFESAYKDRKQIAYLKRLKESKVTLLCNHTPVGVYTLDNKVVGLKILSSQGLINIKATVTVDATSDGHLLRMLDVEKRYGRDVDGKTVPFSVISNYVWNNIRCGVNEDAGHVNQYDNRDFSQKIVYAHRTAVKYFSRGDYLSLATRTGLREGVSYTGEQTLKYSDVILNTPPQKILFWAYSDLDRHGNDRAIDEELFQSWWVVSNLATIAMRIGVPLGSVVPKGIKGFATAGRCFSCDSYSQSAVRMIRDMFRMGECVGALSSLACEKDGDLMAIDYQKYLEIVKNLGCFEGDTTKNVGFDYPGKQKPYRAVEFDVDKNLELLKTETPGAAIWSCFVSKDYPATKEKLYSLIKDAQTDLERYNCALALGIMGDKTALPYLREIVNNRDCFYFKDCRRSNQFRTASAICLLGRIGEQQDIKLLEEIAFNKKEIQNPIYHTLEPNYLYYKHGDRNFVFFDVWTHATNSLVKIYKRLGLDLSSLNNAFIRLSNDQDFIESVVPNQPAEHTARVELTDFIEHLIKQTQN